MRFVHIFRYLFPVITFAFFKSSLVDLFSANLSCKISCVFSVRGVFIQKLFIGHLSREIVRMNWNRARRSFYNNTSHWKSAHWLGEKAPYQNRVRKWKKCVLFISCSFFSYLFAPPPRACATLQYFFISQSSSYGVGISVLNDFLWFKISLSIEQTLLFVKIVFLRLFYFVSYDCKFFDIFFSLFLSTSITAVRSSNCNSSQIAF